MIKATLKLITPLKTIETKILSAMVAHINSRINRGAVQSKISNQASSLILSVLKNSATVQSIISGELRGSLGIASPSDIEAINFAISQTVNVTVQKASVRGGSIQMSLTLTAVPIDLQSVVGQYGQYRTEKGTSIRWFDWLTTLGDAVIVAEYTVEGGHPRSSRTGDKIMVAGKGWRVPPQHAGTIGNNFITKATDDILVPLGNFIEKTIRTAI